MFINLSFAHSNLALKKNAADRLIMRKNFVGSMTLPFLFSGNKADLRWERKHNGKHHLPMREILTK